jgi:hypothetical protein
MWSGRNYKFADVSEKRAARLKGTTSLRIVHFTATAVRRPHIIVHSRLGIGGEWVKHCSTVASISDVLG